MVSVEKKREEKKVSQSQTLLEIALEKKTNKAEQRDREKKNDAAQNNHHTGKRLSLYVLVCFFLRLQTQKMFLFSQIE